MIYNVSRAGCYLQNIKSIHAKVAHLVVEIQVIFMMQQGTGGYLQNFKSIHTKL